MMYHSLQRNSLTHIPIFVAPGESRERQSIRVVNRRVDDVYNAQTSGCMNPRYFLSCPTMLAIRESGDI